jgi:hypothetical protein
MPEDGISPHRQSDLITEVEELSADDIHKAMYINHTFLLKFNSSNPKLIYNIYYVILPSFALLACFNIFNVHCWII